MNLKDRIKAMVAALDVSVRPWASRGPVNALAYDVLLFALKQAWACLFGAVMLVLLAGTFVILPRDAVLARYDFLMVAAVVVQGVLLALRLQRLDEVFVALIFQVAGTVVEVFRAAHGSGVYPDPSLLQLGGGPLFTGLMYACVGSYMARAWRLFDITFIRYPPFWSAWILAGLAYLNFFTHHYVPDIRIGLFALSLVLFGRTWIVFIIDETPRRAPMIVGLVLVAALCWLGENIGAQVGAWSYPGQQDGWRAPSADELGAWYLLMLVSFVLVSLARRPVDACVARIREGIRAAA